MIQIEKILFPTDFSDHSNHALDYAIEFAKRFRAKIILTHIVAVPTYIASYEINVDLTSMRETLVESAEKMLDELTRKLLAQGVESETHTAIGNSFVEIVRLAKEQNVDLIILGTHGWGALKHLLLGSTAERVVRKAPCPVLTVHNPQHEFVHPSELTESKTTLALSN